MMKAGVPLVQSFDIVSDGLSKPAMKALLQHIRTDVASGSGFAAALRKHPLYFDDLFCNLVESGEQSGALETLLDRIAIYKEKSEALKAKVKKALLYPTIVLTAAIGVSAILLIWVIPQFGETFANFGGELPAYTLFVLGISEWMQEWWWIVLALIVSAFYLIRTMHRRSPGFRRAVDKSALRFPVIGKIVYNGIIARYARTLSTTFAAGVPLIDSLESVAGATGNIVYQRGVLEIRDNVATGVQLHQAMRSSKLFPNMALQMTVIGEESGSLDYMLEKVADYHEEVVDNKVDKLTTLLEPMTMVVLGFVVGGLLIAMYLPIFHIGKVI